METRFDDETTGYLESIVSIICLRFNRLPDEIEDKTFSEILKIYSYIIRGDKIQEEQRNTKTEDD